MSKRIIFTSIEQVRSYAQKRFPADMAFSRMSVAEKAYANVYGMTGNGASLSQLKQFLTGKTDWSATKERIYKFFAERIVVEEIDALYDAAKADECRAFVD